MGAKVDCLAAVGTAVVDKSLGLLDSHADRLGTRQLVKNGRLTVKGGILGGAD